MPKKLSVLGSTGSIGRQTLDVIRSMPMDFGVAALAGHGNIKLLFEQVKEFEPDIAVCGTAPLAETLREMCAAEGIGTVIMHGPEGLEAAASIDAADAVLSAIVGAAGLKPALTAITAGKTLLLANKETLVAGGALVIERARLSGSAIIPVDSEHSAIFQCLNGQDRGGVRNILLTASGGPFRGKDAAFLKEVRPEQALKHPNWAMGPKITIDSATLMNKGLEVIEAHWLFGVDYDNINVVVHPESAIHSMVEFIDGSIIAQLGVPDMRLPIQYAMTHPERRDGISSRLDPLKLASMRFEAPDRVLFPSLDLAYSAGRAGGLLPAAMNAANEKAVESFLNNEIGFTDIPFVVESVMNLADTVREPGLDDVLGMDGWARIKASEVIGTIRR